MRDPLSSRLRHQRVLILDGGLATELEARGHDLGDDLWSARLLVDDPESIRNLHLDYLEAGADCIVSASYQASVPGFRRHGLSAGEAEGLLRRSVELALSAREEFWAATANRAGRLRPLVAAGVGPYGAWLADGSEYRGDYHLDEAGLVEFHRRRLAVLADSGADLIACETIPSAVEARVLVDLLEAMPGRTAWVSFSCRNGKQICDGTPISEIAHRIEGSPAAALGVNCTAPRHLPSLIAALRRGTDKPIVAYPNSGERYEAGGKHWLPGEPQVELADEAVGWVERGARIVGGCCRTGPKEIRDLRRSLLGP